MQLRIITRPRAMSVECISCVISQSRQRGQTILYHRMLNGLLEQVNRQIQFDQRRRRQRIRCASRNHDSNHNLSKQNPMRSRTTPTYSGRRKAQLTADVIAKFHRGHSRKIKYDISSKCARMICSTVTALLYAAKNEGPNGVCTGSSGLRLMASAKKGRWTCINAKQRCPRQKCRG